MTDRDKLTALLDELFEEGLTMTMGYMADYLTKHGVTVQKHGQWIEYSRAHYFKCSECKYTVPYRKAALHDGYREYNYCPHCGARMDGEK